MRSRLFAVVAAVAMVFAVAFPAFAAGAPDAATALKKIGVTRGICVLPGDRECKLALDLARTSELTLFVQLTVDADVDAARRAADDAGLLNRRIYVEKGDPGFARIGLADDLADAVVVAGGVRRFSISEALRVVRPEGKVLTVDEEWVKTVPAGIDDWSHPFRRADNNPQSKDEVARGPYLTQFIVEPRYGPNPQAAVASAGRVFMAFGHVAWHPREEPLMNTLVAMNGYNGTVLWTRKLTPGIMVDRSTMVATPTALYLADEKSCKVLDPATGRLLDEITAPAENTDGTFWKWMAIEDGVLYALVGQAEALDPDAAWKMNGHGWPWGKISKGYNQPTYEWGFGRTLVALDPKTKKTLWYHREDEPMDSRALCMKGGRIYVSSFGKYLACLNAKTGETVWRKTVEKDPAVFEAIGPYRPTHGYIQGWKSTAYLKCSDKALYFVGPQTERLTALSAETGDVLFKVPQKDLQVLIRDDGLYTIGGQGTKDDSHRLDPLTGKVLADYSPCRRACTRITGSLDALFFRAAEGTARIDLPAGTPQFILSMRPSCHVGVIIANGRLYWLPWACDCNLQMFGTISLGPAGRFDFAGKAVDAERLEAAPDAQKVAPFAASPADWPAYRHDNVRAAATGVAVPDKVALLWQFKPKAPVEATAPVAAGGLVFVAGSDGVLRALDAATGKARWTACTGGTVRYPPAIADGRAFVGSGDGYAYAFEAATGRELWRFRAAPEPRKIPVFGSLLSTWPVASGVLVDDGVAYLAAGINSFDGTHVYALDAATGKMRWQNSTSGNLNAEARTGVAVQGDLLLFNKQLYLAGGNGASPGVYDIADGKCVTSAPPSGGARAPRGRELRLSGERVEAVGQPFYSPAGSPVLDAGANKWGIPEVRAKNVKLRCLVHPGETAWKLEASDPATDKPLWELELPSAPVRWGLAVDAQGRIFVTLATGEVLCFGGAQ